MSNRFDPPSIRERGQVARAMAAVQRHKPTLGEYSGKIMCTKCGGRLSFTIFSNGISRGYCACGVKWSQ